MNAYLRTIRVALSFAAVLTLTAGAVVTADEGNDMRSKGFVEGVDRVGLSSLQLDSMQKNRDGSADIYFAPQAPKSLQSNWIPTGEDFFLLFRPYGPDKPLFDKSWALDDIEKVNN